MPWRTIPEKAKPQRTRADLHRAIAHADFWMAQVSIAYSGRGHSREFVKTPRT